MMEGHCKVRWKTKEAAEEGWHYAFKEHFPPFMSVEPELHGEDRLCSVPDSTGG